MLPWLQQLDKASDTSQVVSITRASGEELKALQLLTSFVVRASMRIVQLRALQEGAAEDPAAGATTTIPPKRLSKAGDH